MIITDDIKELEASLLSERFVNVKPLVVEFLEIESSNRCMRCEASFSKPHKGFRRPSHLDHDHQCCRTGCLRCLRGIVCVSCNTGPLCETVLMDGFTAAGRTARYLQLRKKWYPKFLRYALAVRRASVERAIAVLDADWERSHQ